MTSPPRKSSQHQRRSPRARLGLERLEPRDVPAGNVVSSFVNGDLTLTGDPNDNDIRIAGGGINAVLVTPMGTTTINGSSAPLLLPMPHSLSLRLGKGSDTVEFDITGNFSVAGDLSISFDGSNSGPVNMVTRVVNPGNYTMQVLGDVTIQYGNGIATTQLHNMVVIDNLTVRHANGDSTFLFDNVKSPAAFSQVGGNLSVTNGTGADDNRILDTNVSGNVTIQNGGPRTADGAAGSNQIGNATNTGLHSRISGNVLIKNPSGNSALGTQVGDVDVAGNVTLRLGGGAFNGSVQSLNSPTGVTVGGTLTVSGTPTWTGTMTLGRPGFVTTVRKNLTVATGNAAATIQIDGLTVLGATSIHTGSGSDTVNIDTSGGVGSLFAGSFNLGTGPGADAVNINTGTETGTTYFKRAVTVTLGAQDDTLTMGTAGLNQVRFDRPAPGRALFDGGGGTNKRVTGTYLGLTTFKNFI